MKVNGLFTNMNNLNIKKIYTIYFRHRYKIINPTCHKLSISLYFIMEVRTWMVVSFPCSYFEKNFEFCFTTIGYKTVKLYFFQLLRKVSINVMHLLCALITSNHCYGRPPLMLMIPANVLPKIVYKDLKKQK